MQFKYAELFAGLALATLAIDEVFPDNKCVFYSEVEKNRCDLLSKLLPGVKNIGDISMLQGFIDNLPRFNFGIGGSPCQNLSIANTKTREGLDGFQSSLFYQYLDLLAEKKPEWFLLENVASMDKSDRDEITRELSKVAGKRVEPVEINSLYFTGQARRRLYWCNFPILPLPTEAVDPRHCIDKSVLPDRPTSEFIDVAELHNAFKKSGPMANPKNFAKDSSDWDFISWSRSTRYREFEDTKEFSEWMEANDGLKYKILSKNAVYPLKISYVEQRIKINLQANTLLTGPGCSIFSSRNFIRHKTKMRMLTPLECARLQGIPDGHLGDLLNKPGAAYKAIGDSFTLPVITHIMKSLKAHIEG